MFTPSCQRKLLHPWLDLWLLVRFTKHNESLHLALERIRRNHDYQYRGIMIIRKCMYQEESASFLKSITGNGKNLIPWKNCRESRKQVGAQQRGPKVPGHPLSCDGYPQRQIMFRFKNFFFLFVIDRHMLRAPTHSIRLLRPCTLVSNPVRGQGCVSMQFKYSFGNDRVNVCQIFKMIMGGINVLLLRP